MSISLEWFNQEKTILLGIFDGIVTIDAYHQIVDDTGSLLKTCPHMVHIMADFSTLDRTQLPDNLLAIQRYAELHLPPNRGIVVFVQPDLMFMEVIKIGKRLNMDGSKHTFRAFSREEALQTIEANANLVQERGKIASYGAS